MVARRPAEAVCRKVLCIPTVEPLAPTFLDVLASNSSSSLPDVPPLDLSETSLVLEELEAEAGMIGSADSQS